MGFRIVSAILYLIAIIFLPIWPYHTPWPREANLIVCGFCFLVGTLTLILSFIARHGSPVWRGRGHG